MSRQALATLLMLALTGHASGQIYKVTDEDGNVHFTDKPIGEQAERIAIQSRRTNPERVQAMVNERAEAAAKAAEEESQAAPQGPTEEELRARAEQRAKQCQKYRERLQRFVQSRRIYREDENGERVYLSEEEMQETRQNAEDKVKEYCDS